MDLQVVKLTSDYEKYFMSHIENNFADYFFFHVDYMQYPEDTEIFLALNKEKSIEGMLLLWNENRMQLRGSVEGVRLLMDTVKKNPKSVTGFEMHKEIIYEYFPDYKNEIALYRMGLKRGNQKLFEKYENIRLSEENIDEIISLMNNADPVFWGSRKPEDLLIDDNNIWFGIKKRNILSCIVGVWLYEKIGYITIVGTHPDYWRKGMASSLISSALKEIFKEHEYCYIQVRVENPPAINLYTKIGFRICNTQFSYEKEN